MSVGFMGFTFVGLALVAVIVALALWRHLIAVHEDDTLHVASGGAVAQQTHVAHQLDAIDRWGKILTAIAAVYLICLFGYYCYSEWLVRGVIPR
jgi:hypothetical protein